MSKKKKINLPAKIEKPLRAKQYEISYEKTSTGSTEADAAVLSTLLNVSFEKAHKLVLEAHKTGQASVLVASGEVVETKMKQAGDRLSNLVKENPEIPACRITAKPFTP